MITYLTIGLITLVLNTVMQLFVLPTTKRGKSDLDEAVATADSVIESVAKGSKREEIFTSVCWLVLTCVVQTALWPIATIYTVGMTGYYLWKERKSAE